MLCSLLKSNGVSDSSEHCGFCKKTAVFSNAIQLNIVCVLYYQPGMSTV